eukprot:TRINITY_DN25016_c0_g2_i1.p1 TRINITY_DN25016_c0_g2~~TRINITY_DN25016_c0_g2_i1.p1  ORF type:complete len:675 (-),score=148.54 TRINITY_DN25016_c0_g2_i1:37-2061(-)
MSLRDGSAVGSAAPSGSEDERIAPRCPRLRCRDVNQAEREQRRLIVERELRERLGLSDEDTKVATPPQQAADLGTTFSRSERPLSARRGPTRPPKPRPHRPLATATATGSGVSDVSTAATESGQLSTPRGDSEAPSRRWRSALTEIWPDRHAAESAGVSSAGATGTSEDGGCEACCSPNSTAFGVALAAELCREGKLNVAVAQDASLPEAAPPSRDATPPAQRQRGLSLAVAPPETAMPLYGTPRPGRRRFVALGAVVAESAVPLASSSEPLPTAPAELPEQKEAAQSSASTPTLGPAREKTPCSRPQSSGARTEASKLVSERTRLLEENTRLLRKNMDKVRAEGRRHRIFGSTAPSNSVAERSTSSSSPVASASREREASSTAPLPKHLEDLRKRIALLDEVNNLEREKLEQEQRDAEERRKAQEAFERDVQDRTERDLRETRLRCAREEADWSRRKEEERREREERDQRRQEQLLQQEAQSRKLEEQRREGRSDAAQLAWWKCFEDELEKQWAAQEAEERRRLEQYATARSRQVDEWERRLIAERQKLGHSAEFAEAMRQRKAKSAAFADNAYYGPQRGPPPAEGRAASPRPPQPPPNVCSAATADTKAMGAEERAVLRDFQAVKGATREVQKAKVKELLLKWHPDKNPENEALSTRVFQFVQQQRQVVLGL